MSTQPPNPAALRLIIPSPADQPNRLESIREVRRIAHECGCDSTFRNGAIRLSGTRRQLASVLHLLPGETAQ